MQAPMKEQYRQQPGTALITLRAEGRLGEGVTCKIETGKALVEAGLHPATGGDGRSACSGDMLLEALVGCAGVTLKAVATALGIRLRDATVRAEGDLDFRGTLAVARDAPVGFREIRLRFELPSVPDDELEALLKLTERYCVVYQTLARGVPVIVSRDEICQVAWVHSDNSSTTVEPRSASDLPSQKLFLSVTSEISSAITLNVPAASRRIGTMRR